MGVQTTAMLVPGRVIAPTDVLAVPFPVVWSLVEAPMYVASGYIIARMGGTWVCVKTDTMDGFFPKLNVGGGRNGGNVLPVDVNGRSVWTYDGWTLMYSLSFSSWVLTQSGASREPVENYDAITGKYSGDAFYTVSGGIFWKGIEVPFDLTPRGSLRDGQTGDPPVAQFVWPRWEKEYDEKDGLGLGRYESKDNDDTSTMVLGLPAWTGRGGTYVRSLRKDRTGRFTYGDATYDSSAGKYVIGVYKSKTGWWEGPSDRLEPGSSVTFHFTYDPPDEGSDPPDVQPDIELTWSGYELGSGTAESACFLCDIARWYGGV